MSASIEVSICEPLPLSAQPTPGPKCFNDATARADQRQGRDLARATSPRSLRSPAVCGFSHPTARLGVRSSHQHERCVMAAFLKPLIGFTVSTSILTSLMVFVSHVG